MQPEFENPDFIENNSAEEIHERMMESLPDDIDDTPGGFAYDFTMPAALEKAELIEFYMATSIMIAFPEYAWGEWLDLHGRQVGVTRHPERRATGKIRISGTPGVRIEAGTIFCTPATDTVESLEFTADAVCVIGEDGSVEAPITAVEGGSDSNVRAGTITLMDEPDREVTSVTNLEPTFGGAEEEQDDDYYDRIALEYASKTMYVGNDSDYERWAKEAGAGDCIVIPAADGPGTIRLALVGTDGQPAGEPLVKAVYDHIVSPDERKKRLLPTACAKLSCVAASTVEVSYACTGLQFDASASIEQIKEDFERAVREVYKTAKTENVLRYNDVRPLMSAIEGVRDFSEFYINGGTSNVVLENEEYPKTGTVDFR